MADYYEVLQVSPKAEPEVIEGAYKQLARKYHPDINKSPDAPAHMKAINVAYQVLSDPTKRAQYDQQRALQNTPPPSPTKPPPSPYTAPPPRRPYDPYNSPWHYGTPYRARRTHRPPMRYDRSPNWSAIIGTIIFIIIMLWMSGILR